MDRTKKNLIASAMIIALTTGPMFAQDCILSPEFCTRLRPEMVVFVGTEVGKEDSEEPEPGDISMGRHTLVTFNVEEALWGLSKETRTVRIRFSEGYESSTKPRFLLATPGKSGQFFVNYCGGGLMLPVDDAWAQEFREYLKNSARANVPVRVVALPNYSQLSSTRIRMQGNGGTFEGMADGSGQLTFSAMPAGVYSVMASKAHYSLDEGERSISILPGSCAELTIRMQSLTRISGQILDSSGNPVRSARGFDFISWSTDQNGQDYSKSRPFETDAEGKFSVEGLVPGTYYLGSNIWETAEPRQSPFPRTYYPGVKDRASAKPLVIRPGASLEGIVFHLPSFGKKRHLTVRVMSADGVPVEHAIIEDGPAGMDETTVASIGPSQFTDDLGVAAFNVWAASEYRVDARLVLTHEFHQSEPIAISTSDSDTETTIVLEDLFLRAAPK